MASKRIKYARAHLSRRRHIALLARPHWRRTAPDFNSIPRPFTVSRAALRARTSKRIKMMARPKHQPKSNQSRVLLQYSRERREPSRWLFDLALPKKRLLVSARRYLLAQGNRAMLANISAQLRGLSKSRYQSYRIICNALRQRAAARQEKIRKKLRRCLCKPSDWERHNKFLEVFARPKSYAKPAKRSPGRRGKGKKKKQLPDPARMNLLAQPARKKTTEIRDPFRVRATALKYEITDRTRELAQHRVRQDQEPIRELGTVALEALQAHANSRILELAKPMVREPGAETDLREDAFSVSPMALKAVCRPRVKVLAQPKKRRAKA
ncbi:testicular haploid expressed gene protein-like [Phymastichus coffea]|uniref:testicular haploid expressed gene protein-like n=1 Tax=Phymastichus coffea TaxID=108790 RepID=UPI00273B5E13|nr:testicular haploid expressed gene protein-like [Phymastichus coffea]